MKNIVVVIVLLLSFSGVQSKERVINQPPFIVSNTNIIEIEKIVLSDTATVLHMKAFFYPNNWIKLDKRALIIDDNGKEYAIRSVSGLTLGEEFWMPESGEASFTMNFPPLPNSTKSIDFTEGDEHNFWSIWGIQLKSNKLPKLKLPGNLQKQKIDVKESLPETTIERGKAVISGKILDYKKGITAKFLSNSIFNNESKLESLDIDEDGTFRKEITVFSPTWISISIARGKGIKILVAPKKETKVTINLREIIRSRSRIRVNEKQQDEALFFEGDFAALNTEINKYNNEKEEHFLGINFEQLIQELKGKDFAECKSYLINKYEETIEDLNKETYSHAYKQIMRLDADLKLCTTVFSIPSFLLTSNIKDNELTEEEQNEYVKNFSSQVPSDFYRTDNDLSKFNTYAMLYAPYAYDFIEIFNQIHPNVREYFIEKCQTDKGILFDLLDIKKIESQFNDLTPLAEQEMQVLNNLPYPDLKEKLAETNTKLLADREKYKNEIRIHDLEEVANEDLFTSIISKFEGKIILVDFWATWCGPCRTANKEMKPMKEELSGKDIVYIYLAGENSPEDVWNNMITGIPGEHFRLTDDQWRHLGKEFDVEGVPTYLIVDRDGNISYKTVGYPGSDTIKKEIIKAVDK